jgi:hypothetical protein
MSAATDERPPAAGHETRDVEVRPVVLTGIALLASLALFGAAGRRLLDYYEAREARSSSPASPLAATYARREPPEPRLQAHPLADLARLHAEEDRLLHGYAWVDREAGTVRIPIERAIDLLVARGATGGAVGER